MNWKYRKDKRMNNNVFINRNYSKQTIDSWKCTTITYQGNSMDLFEISVLGIPLKGKDYAKKNIALL